MAVTRVTINFHLLSVVMVCIHVKNAMLLIIKRLEDCLKGLGHIF